MAFEFFETASTPACRAAFRPNPDPPRDHLSVILHLLSVAPGTRMPARRAGLFLRHGRFRPRMPAHARKSGRRQSRTYAAHFFTCFGGVCRPEEARTWSH